jgi:hypothetical protein
MDRENIGSIVALCGVQGCCPTAGSLAPAIWEE